MRSISIKHILLLFQRSNLEARVTRLWSGCYAGYVVTGFHPDSWLFSSWSSRAAERERLLYISALSLSVLARPTFPNPIMQNGFLMALLVGLEERGIN